MDNCVIYKIVVGEGRKTYVGSSIHGLKQRQSEHLNLLRRGLHHNRHLQNYHNKYGHKSFVFSVIEEVGNREKILEREQYWIDTLKPKLNVMRDVKSHIGVKRSPETCRKISEALKGRKRSPSTIEKMRAAFIGKSHDPAMMEALHDNNHKPIKQIFPDGTTTEWKSATDAASTGKYNRKSIYRCLRGVRKTHKYCEWAHL